MHVEQRTGHVPGTIYATIRHGNTHRTICVTVERTDTGRFVARMPDNRWSPECMTVDNAILLHAAVTFPVEAETSPWLNNPQPVPKFEFVDRSRAVKLTSPPSRTRASEPSVDDTQSCVSFESV